jgi:hypothetical protein
LAIYPLAPPKEENLAELDWDAYPEAPFDEDVDCADEAIALSFY